MEFKVFCQLIKFVKFDEKFLKFLVCQLQPHGEYEFRVVAKNSAGFGLPSKATPLTQLRPKYGAIPASYDKGDSPNVPFPPGRPQIVAMDGNSVTLHWEPPISSGSGGPILGYHIEYRPPNSTDWLLANDYVVPENRFQVRGLRPNGEYEFRVFAKNADGLSESSQSTGIVRIKPAAPPRSAQHQSSPAPADPTSPRGGVPPPPSQPQITDVDSSSASLLWSMPAGTPRQGPGKVLGYLVEYREIGDPQWYSASERLITDLQYVGRQKFIFVFFLKLLFEKDSFLFVL